MKNTRSNSIQDCLDQLRAKDEQCIAIKTTLAESVTENAQLLNKLEVLNNELEVQSDSRKVEQIALEKLGSRYLNLFETAPVGYLTLDVNGLILEANLLAATLLGVHPNKIFKSHFCSYLTPESADWHNLKILSLTQHNKLQNYEIEICDENGSLRNLQVNAVKMKTKNDCIIFQITLVDFTQKKRGADHFQREKEKRAAELVIANQELIFQNVEKEKRAAELVIANQELIFQNVEKEKRAAELVIANQELIFQNVEKEKRAAELVIANLELIFQNVEKEKRAAELVIVNHELSIAATIFESQEVMMVTDTNKIILRVNKAFSSETGYSAEEAIGQTPRLLNSGKQSKDFYEKMWKCINTTGAWEGEIWNRRKSGDIYPEHLSITAVKDTSGIVSNYVATLTGITMSQAAADEIKSLAFYDPLTLLPNRRLFLDRLKQALASSARSGEAGALLFLDLDHFKILNDSLGHDIGDLLLQQVAIRLSDCIREEDTIARIGGDEFVVLLVNLSVHGIETAAQIKNVAEKIIVSLNKPYQLNSHTYYNTSSIGATLFNGQGVGTEELLKQADIAMYQSKSEGRNTLRFFDPLMQKAVTARADLERELRKAIEQHEFQLYYQVQVESAGRLCGAEVLIRWQHPERGLILPYYFIPLAEETGLILPIGQWVLETACAQLKIWEQSVLTKDLKLSVNVSARQFHQADFIEQVTSAINRHSIDPKRLKLELTESMLVHNIDDIITKMNVLSKVGILFSLDDFGTGYSSLQYLKMLPLDQLKIDRSFVRDISTNSSDRAIVRTIIIMASSLDINVIAEGVETEEQRQFLFDNDCSNYQGYLFGKPVPIDQFESLYKLCRLATKS